MKKTMSRYTAAALFALLAITAVLGLSACTTPRIDVYVASQPNVNPDDSNRPSPVIIRIYELRNDMAFEQADFYTLFEQFYQVLAADILSAKELTCVPGRAYEVNYMPISSDVRFLGIVAGFRQMERAHWRLLVPVNSEDKNEVKIEINDTTLILVPENEAAKWTPEKALEDYHTLMNRMDVNSEPAQVVPNRPVDRPGGRPVRLERLNPNEK